MNEGTNSSEVYSQYRDVNKSACNVCVDQRERERLFENNYATCVEGNTYARTVSPVHFSLRENSRKMVTEGGYNMAQVIQPRTSILHGSFQQEKYVHVL